MYEAHWNGGTVIRPLFFEFTKDAETYDLGNQFMWGSGMMFIPVVTEVRNHVELTAVFCSKLLNRAAAKQKLIFLVAGFFFISGNYGCNK